VEDATVVSSGDVEASVNLESRKTEYSMYFVLENCGDTTVCMCHCDLLRTVGFTRGRIENTTGVRGMIDPGQCNMQFLLLCLQWHWWHYLFDPYLHLFVHMFVHMHVRLSSVWVQCFDCCSVL